MTTIKSIDEIKNAQGKIYVRWSQSIAKDIKRGYSLFAGTSREAGLSCCEIDRTWDDWRIIRQLSEYGFVGGFCWLVTGAETGRGADNEPLLRDVELIGKVSESVWSADWKAMECEADVKDHLERLERITDPIGRDIVEKSLTKLMAQALGRIGGRSTSKRKAAASRANGRRGGRPRTIKGDKETK